MRGCVRPACASWSPHRVLRSSRTPARTPLWLLFQSAPIWMAIGSGKISSSPRSMPASTPLAAFSGRADVSAGWDPTLEGKIGAPTVARLRRPYGALRRDMSPRTPPWSARAREALGGPLFFLILALFAPVLLLAWAGGRLRARWLGHRKMRGARDLGHVFGVAVVDHGLALYAVATRSTVTLADVARVSMTLLEGDHGLADANSETYLFVAETRAGERVAFRASWQGLSDWERLVTLKRDLGALEIYEDGGRIPGAITPAFVPLLLGALTCVWLVGAAVVWR